MECTICLQSWVDRTLLPVCAHEFCFECILRWSDQSRKCPLCARSFDGTYLIHRIRSQYDYQKYYLPPHPSSPSVRRPRRLREQVDQLDRAIARRRSLYQHHLYAKHVASNPFTRYRPFPTPAQFAASPDLVRRMTMFLRRELRVWPNLDVEFLTTYTIALMKAIDVRSESAIKLVSEFLDLDTPYTPGARHVNAEHFVHEIYCYLRSPYRDLNMYDQMAQYDAPAGIPAIERGRWSAAPSPSRSRSRSRSPVSAPASADTSAHQDGPHRHRCPSQGGDDPRHQPDATLRGASDPGPSTATAVDIPQPRIRGNDDDDGRLVPHVGIPDGGAVAGLNPLERSGPVDAPSANVHPSRHRASAGNGPRHRTLSASVQAHLAPTSTQTTPPTLRRSDRGCISDPRQHQRQ